MLYIRRIARESFTVQRNKHLFVQEQQMRRAFWIVSLPETLAGHNPDYFYAGLEKDTKKRLYPNGDTLDSNIKVMIILATKLEILVTPSRHCECEYLEGAYPTHPS